MTHCAFMITEDDGVLSFRDRHLAPAAVEMQSEALSIVQEEQGSAFFCSLMDRAYAELVSDAVFRAHQFCSGTVSQLKGLL